MIYAKLRLGPEYAPNGFIMVEILEQRTFAPYGRFLVRDPRTNEQYEAFEAALTLKWWEPPQPQSSNPS